VSNFPTLDTDRLLLREIVAEDAPALFTILSNAEAMCWLGTDPLSDLKQAARMVETFSGWRKMPNPGTRWGIQRKGANELIGSCGLFKWNRDWKNCVIGFELAQPARGVGYMREAASAMLAWGFENMELHRVQAQVHPENAASITLLRALGFIQEGHLREAGFWLGRHHDLLQFALLRHDYISFLSKH